MTRPTITALVAMLALTACDSMARGTANTAGFVANTAVRGTYEAGKLVYRGGRYVVVGSEDDTTQ